MQTELKSDAEQVVQHILTTEIANANSDKRRFMLGTLLLVGKLRFESEEIVVKTLIAKGVKIADIREAINSYAEDFCQDDPLRIKNLHALLTEQ